MAERHTVLKKEDRRTVLEVGHRTGREAGLHVVHDGDHCIVPEVDCHIDLAGFGRIRPGEGRRIDREEGRSPVVEARRSRGREGVRRIGCNRLAGRMVGSEEGSRPVEDMESLIGAIDQLVAWVEQRRRTYLIAGKAGPEAAAHRSSSC